MAHQQETGISSETPLKTNGKSITALVLGVVGLVSSILIPLAGFALGLVGLILGILSIREIKRRGESGKGLAIGGIACSVAALVLTVILMALAAAMLTL
ncbi:DUF4190 domain-containing protein [Thalassobacillus sp. C254]|uniref:DUF4190 domain-containing protein n=1 Tax=Thalassobacillus sp. C254 TaxID=1225341 RepID=UPI0006D21267|nr:DUF4190 domain-containing protein [Thalassobacillus sp. C254]